MREREGERERLRHKAGSTPNTIIRSRNSHVTKRIGCKLGIYKIRSSIRGILNGCDGLHIKWTLDCYGA